MNILFLPLRWFLGLRLHWRILIALGLGIATGLAVNLAGGEGAVAFGEVTWVEIFGFIGGLFLRALMMVIVPLIVASIVTGVSGIGSGRALGRLGGKTLLYYMTTSVLAILTGLLVVNLVRPGIVGGEPAGDRLGLTQADRVAGPEGGEGMASLVGIFERMIPENPIRAAAEMDILPLIVFSILLGYVLTVVGEPHRSNLRALFEAFFHVMMRMTWLVIAFVPLGVFALISRMVAMTGVDAFRPMSVYMLTVAAALMIHLLITLPLILRLVGGINPLRHYRAVAPAMLTAFSTASSSATLPLTMHSVERRAGVSNRVSSFTLPLGATINMDGTALFECVAVIFIGQAYGLEMTLTHQVIIVVTALLASIGAAGIPAAGLVMMAIILTALGWPLEAIAWVMAVDLPLDMLRTMTNVTSDTCGAAVIARSEGERPAYPLDAGDRPDADPAPAIEAGARRE